MGAQILDDPNFIGKPADEQIMPVNLVPHISADCNRIERHRRCPMVRSIIASHLRVIPPFFH
jgi:hypothetical protein